MGLIPDITLKNALAREKEMIEDDYEYAKKIADEYKYLIDPAKFTLENY